MEQNFARVLSNIIDDNQEARSLPWTQFQMGKWKSYDFLKQTGLKYPVPFFSDGNGPALCYETKNFKRKRHSDSTKIDDFTINKLIFSTGNKNIWEPWAPKEAKGYGTSAMRYYMDRVCRCNQEEANMKGYFVGSKSTPIAVLFNTGLLDTSNHPMYCILIEATQAQHEENNYTAFFSLFSFDISATLFNPKDMRKFLKISSIARPSELPRPPVFGTPTDLTFNKSISISTQLNESALQSAVHIYEQLYGKKYPQTESQIRGMLIIGLYNTINRVTYNRSETVPCYYYNNKKDRKGHLAFLAPGRFAEPEQEHETNPDFAFVLSLNRRDTYSSLSSSSSSSISSSTFEAERSNDDQGDGYRDFEYRVDTILDLKTTLFEARLTGRITQDWLLSFLEYDSSTENSINQQTIPTIVVKPSTDTKNIESKEAKIIVSTTDVKKPSTDPNRIRGKVTDWFPSNKMKIAYGFIKSDDAQYRSFYFNTKCTYNGLELKAGDLVEFTPTRTNKGKGWMALGVVVIT